MVTELKKFPPLPTDFYLEADVVKIAKQLLGKLLFTDAKGMLTGGMIVETESYGGTTDRACHAYLGKCTERTQTMFQKGGVAYIYLCYGIHNMLNIVTHLENHPCAVLIRAIEPLYGVDIMLKRRKIKTVKKNLTAGPGALSQALGITRKSHNGLSFSGNKIWISEGKCISEKNIVSSPRVGVSYAKEDALLPWRFRIKDNAWTSPAK